MSAKSVFSILTLVLLASQPVSAQVDSTYVDQGERIYQLEQVTVTARSLRWGVAEMALGKEALQHVLAKGGVTFVRRGGTLTGDLYVDGFKRGDVEVVIDGERFPASCPNRMDPPLTRVNPLEMASVQLERSSAALQAGLGGRVNYRRATPDEAWSLRGVLSQTGGAGRDTDVSLALERAGQRLTGRFLQSAPYEDGSGRSFQDRYGYAPGDLDYRLVELSLYGERATWSYGATLSFTNDVPFPYLLMDERENTLWAAFLSFRGHKLYVNHTHHVMDNGLRRSAGMMTMETDATNLTVGLTGPSYELFYRNWDAWNTMQQVDMGGAMASGPASTGAPMKQHLMPDLHLFSAAYTHDVRLRPVMLMLRAGVSATTIADDVRLAFHEAVHPEAEPTRWFVPFSAGAGYSTMLMPGMTGGLHLEVASTPPSPEYLYVGVRRMAPKPSWMGNPGLRAPVKAALRGALERGRVNAEAFVTYVDDYVALAPHASGTQSFVTYDNVDAFMAGVTAQGSWTLADLRAAYTFAQNLTTDGPLAEIPPLTGAATLRSPSFGGLTPYVRVEAAAAQLRVDAGLHEATTAAWMRLDAGATFAYGPVAVSLDLENVTDALYYQHLSYLRDPFAAGLQVYEPGRLVRLGAQVAL